MTGIALGVALLPETDGGADGTGDGALGP